MANKSHRTSRWVYVYIIIIFGLSYELYHQITLRRNQDSIIEQLQILHDQEMKDSIDLSNELTVRQVQIENLNHVMRIQLLNMQRSLYELYNELRKYKKDMPPWGGEYKPIDPEDKWTNNE